MVETQPDALLQTGEAVSVLDSAEFPMSDLLAFGIPFSVDEKSVGISTSESAAASSVSAVSSRR